MGLARVGQGEKVAGVSGILLILAMFVFGWFGVKLGPPVLATGVEVEHVGNAWRVYGSGDLLPTDVVLFVTALAGIGLALLAAVRGSAGVPVALSAVVAGLGLLSVVLIVVSIINPPDFIREFEGSERKIGVWLGLVAALGVAAGGYMATHEEEPAAGASSP
jgi:hypothetical protein